MAPPSPSHKRMRLSSPTYEEGLDEVDEETFDLLEKIDHSLSQQQMQLSPKKPDSSDEDRVRTRSWTETSSSQTKPPSSSQAVSPASKARRMKAIQAALAETDDFDGSTKDEDASKGLRRAFEIRTNVRTPIKRVYTPTSLDDDFGLGKAVDAFSGVRSASEAHLAADFPGFSSAGPSAVGFAAAGTMKPGTLQISEEALKRAKMQMEQWSREIDAEVQVDDDDDNDADNALSSPSKIPLSKKAKTNTAVRPPLASIGNSPKKLASPVSQGFSTPKAFTTPVVNRTAKTNGQRPFKSPFIQNASPRSLSRGLLSPSKPQRPHPLASTPINNSQLSGFTTPCKSFSIGRPSRSTFSTPFKPGMGPGEPGRLELEMSQRTPVKIPAKTHKTQTPSRRKLDATLDPHSLKGCGKSPQSYTFEELEEHGLNISELTQITPLTAPFYSFHTASSNLFPSTQTQQASINGISHTTLGPAEAHEHLTQTGRFTSRKWVDNHWALILWKLAGLAALDPASECDPATRRWCWHSVLSQLEKRHDKEINRGARPALRMIATQDAYPGAPMVLVVSGVLWSQHESVGADGRVLDDACAELEVSDGWYRLRALVDAPLARAVLKGLIRPGRKLAISCARFDNGGRDPREVLDSYDYCQLVLCGNSTHLAPWYATLGFKKEPFYATLRSLTPDGGTVPMIGFVVEKVYPIAYFEFFTGSKPKERRREGPRSEAEEAEIHDKWQKRYDAEEAKVRERFAIKWDRWDDFAERLEHLAGHYEPGPGDDTPPDDIDNQFDELDEMLPGEVPNYLRSLGAYECYWLARYFRRKSNFDREFAPTDIAFELKDRVPPRETRSFRIVAVRDTYTDRKPALRLCHLTIWDVLSLCVSEGGKPGALEVGQRFVVTNLQPMQQRCWMGQAKDDMVCLSTKKSSRFFWIK